MGCHELINLHVDIPTFFEGEIEEGEFVAAQFSDENIKGFSFEWNRHYADLQGLHGWLFCLVWSLYTV